MNTQKKNQRILNSYSSLVQLDRKKRSKDFRSNNGRSRSRSRSPPRNRSNNGRSRSRSRSPPRNRSRNKDRSRSPPQSFDKEKDFVDEVKVPGHDVPDTSFGDYFCKACDSHMNSLQMWDAHVTGKRHLKNVKHPVKGDNKYVYLTSLPVIHDEVEALTQPVLGLSQTCEIQRNGLPACYQCYLCSANIASGKLFIDHILSYKHRMLFLNTHAPEKHAHVLQTSNSLALRNDLLLEIVTELQEQHGKGKMSVKRERIKPKYKIDDFENDLPPPPPSRRSPFRDYPDYPRDRMSPPYYGPDRYGGDNSGSGWLPLDSDRGRDYLDPRALDLDRGRDYPDPGPLPLDYDRGRDYPDPRAYSPIPTTSHSPPRARSYSDMESMSRNPIEDSYGYSQNSASGSFYGKEVDPVSTKGMSNWSSEPATQGDDLRGFIEQKKALSSAQLMEPVKPAELAYDLIRVIDAIPPVEFLKLAIFKSESIDMSDLDQKDLVMKLLKIFMALGMGTINKTNLQPRTNVREEFQRILQKNGVDVAPDTNRSSSIYSIEKLTSLINEYKSFSNRSMQNVTQAASSPVYQTPDYSQQQSSFLSNIPNTQATSSMASYVATSGVSSIPGLTLTEGSSAEQLDPFSQFRQTTKSLFNWSK